MESLSSKENEILHIESKFFNLKFIHMESYSSN